MKKLFFVISLIVITITGYSQKNNTWKVVAMYSGAVILDAIGDAQMDMGQKHAGHLLNAASVGALIMAPIVFNVNKRNWWVYPTMYVGARFMFFDYTYNITRGLPIDYKGSTSYYDNIISTQSGPLIWPRGIVFAVTISLTDRYR